MSIAKKILIDELKNQIHIERVEDVIFWALEFYAKSEENKNNKGGLVAYSITQRILEEEKQ